MKKTIFALHGFMGIPKDWEFLKIQNCEVIAVDYMNIRGLTPDVDLERWGENFNLWAEKKSPMSDRYLVGYSLGGRLALQAIKNAPVKWKKSVLISTNPGLVDPIEKNQRKETDERWAQRFLTMDFERVVREWNSQAVFVNSKHEPVRDLKNYDSDLLAKSLINWSVSKQLNFLSTPSFLDSKQLWIAGEYDSKYVEIVQRIQEANDNVLISIVSGASHRVLFDQPEVAAKVIENHFLD